MTVETVWEPAIIEPTGHGVTPDLAGLTAISRSVDLDALLIGRRGVIFRGFGVRRAELDAAIDLLLPDRLAYTQGNTPRSNLGDNIYTSTEYPADQQISLHSELSYAHRWPSRLLFYCERPATGGGATSAADAGRWLRALDPGVRAAFAGGLRYTQNLHGGRGLGKSWQETFETEDRELVEAFLAEGGASWTWTSTGLRVTQHRAATTHHPVTHEEVWFNQADQWHIGGLPEEIQSMLAELLTEHELPQHVTFADGSPIPVEYIRHVREVGWAHAYDVEWSSGDILLLDNVLAAHARRSYTGERRVLVAMSGS